MSFLEKLIVAMIPALLIYGWLGGSTHTTDDWSTAGFLILLVISFIVVGILFKKRRGRRGPATRKGAEGIDPGSGLTPSEEEQRNLRPHRSPIE